MMEFRQADQLAVAIRSPVSAQEDQQRGGIELIGECPGLAGLIGESNVGDHHSTLIARKAERFPTQPLEFVPGFR